MQRPDSEPAFRPHPRTVRDLRGGVRLAFDALRLSLDKVQQAHERLADVSPPVRGVKPGRPSQGWPGMVYRGLRGTGDVLGGGLDLALASLQSWAQDPHRHPHTRESPASRDAGIAALNAVLGDHLHRTDNPLGLHTTWRIAPPRLPRVLVLAHDLGLDAMHWCREGASFGNDLAAALGATPACLRYNSGRHVAAVAREVAAALEQQLGAWPVPIERVDLLGHGLGGLVLRSALHQALHSGQAWPTHVRHIVYLGTPLAGARPGRVRDLLAGAPSGTHAGLLLARLAGRRSDGMEDFLLGQWLDPESGGATLPPAAPAACTAYAIAGSIGGAGDDGVVPVASALGRELPLGQDPGVTEARRWIAQGVDHRGLVRSDAVLQQVRQWLAA